MSEPIYEAIRVQYVDHMGDDRSVVNAARVSFGKMVDTFTDKDAKLVKYLAKHNHWTPFGHTSVSLRCKLPIFLARQLVKHQVGGVWNEESRRYISTTPTFWLPESLRAAPDGSVKQGSGSDLSWFTALAHYEAIEEHTSNALYTYRKLLEANVAPEQARMVLPLNTMTEWVWTGSVAFWARVYNLRADSHAQKDLKPFVEDLDAIMSSLYPVSWAALTSLRNL